MAPLPLAALRAWARLNDVDYDSLEVQEVSSKGLGLVLQNATAHDENETLLRVPQDLVLSSQLVSDFARVDKNFGQLLEAITERVSVRVSIATSWLVERRWCSIMACFVSYGEHSLEKRYI